MPNATTAKTEKASSKQCENESAAWAKIKNKITLFASIPNRLLLNKPEARPFSRRKKT